MSQIRRAAAAAIFFVSASCAPVDSQTQTITETEDAIAPPCSSYTADLTSVAATLSGGSAYSGQGAANAFDNSTGTYASMVSSTGPHIGQDFGTPREIRRVRLTGTASYSFHGRLEYSDNGSTWTSAVLEVNVPPGSSAWQTHEVDTFGAHRYWRFIDLGGSYYLQIAEIEMMTCASSCTLGSDVATAAQTISAGTAYSGQVASNAFDGLTTGWMSLSMSSNTWVGQDFGSTPQDIRRVRLFGTSSFGFHARLQYSDDNNVWTNAGLDVHVTPGDQTWREFDAPTNNAHRYWRFLDLGTYTYLQIQEIDLLACTNPGAVCGDGIVSGTEQCDGGSCCTASCTFYQSGYSADMTSTAATITGGSAQSGYPATNAFDDNTGTLVSIVSSAGTYIGQDFGPGGRRVRRVRAYRGSVGSYAFSAKLQFSDDAVSWFDSSLGSIQIAAGDSTWRSYDVADHGGHRYWRLLDIGSNWFQIEEIEMLDLGLPVCRAAVGPCDAEERCTGTSASCPADQAAASGTTCRAAAGGCDLAETCNGTATTCPSDQLKPALTVCRDAVVSCDTPETCSGTSAVCPLDEAPTPGSDQSSAATTISGGTAQSGYPATNAFDDNTSTLVSMLPGTNAYIGQDFGAGGRNIRRVRIRRGGIGSYAFAGRLQYSDNNSSWTDTNLTSINVPTNSGWRAFEVNNYGTHRYWRLLDNGTGYFQTEEVEMLETGLCIQELHDASIIMLAHDHQFEPTDFSQMHAGGVTAKAVKLTTDSIDWDRPTRTRYNVSGYSGWSARWQDYRDDVQALADNAANDIIIVRTVADIYNAKLTGKVGAIIASEGALHLEGQLSRVEQFYDLGWRHTQLFWSANQLVDTSQNLTDFGRQVIAEANRLGILIDCSHANPSLVAQITAASSDPIIRSHDVPNAYGGESSDAAILAVTNSGGGHGVFALHFYDGYLGGSSATLDTLVDAIAHAVSVAGIDHVALGGDYFPENGYRWVVADVTRMNELTAALIERGYSYEDVQKLLGLNLLRLYERVWN